MNYISSAYKIQLKLVIDFEFYKKYRAEIDEFDTNILKLSWKALDEKDKNNVVKEIKQYIDLCMQGPETSDLRKKTMLDHRKDILKQIDDLKKNLNIIDLKIAFYESDSPTLYTIPNLNKASVDKFSK